MSPYLMKILVVGISARAMAASAVRSGYPVVALDAFGDRDLKELTESWSLRRDFKTAYSPEAVYTASRNLSFDAVAYTSNLENYPEILARFDGNHRIIGNSPQIVASVRNWVDLFDRLELAGFSAPKTVLVGQNHPVGSGCRWLVKPLLSGGGHGISVYDPEAQPVFGNENGDYVLQEYIPGRPCSASFVANGKECTVLGITEQLIGMPPFGSRGFRYCGSVLPIPEALDPDSGNRILGEIRRLAEFLTQEYGLIGVNGIDFILSNGRVYLTEVNPRYSASMEIIEIAYGLPVFHLHVQSVLNGALPDFDPGVELEGGKSCGKGYIYAEKDVTAPDTDGWHARGIRDIPQSGEKIRKDGPVCTVIVERRTPEEALAELIRRANELKEEIYA